MIEYYAMLQSGAPVAEPSEPAQPEVDGPLSWDAFWRWARQHGISKISDLEDALGYSVKERNPADVRDDVEARLLSR